jgi:hypothetical protein
MKTQEKITYEIDPNNRLIFSKTGTSSPLPKFRKILDGKFQTDGNNALIYHVKQPQGSDIPAQIKLTGNYSLDKAHNLMLTLDTQNNQYAASQFTIKGELLDAKDNEVSFVITTKDSLDKTTTYILKLNGSWQADEHNRLTFNISKETGSPDKLTLQGAWEANNQNQIIYTYTKTNLKTKEKTTNTITLKGYWDITEKHRIIYVLNKETNSQFDFKVSVGKPLSRGLQYEIGIGAVPVKRQITLFGEWKLNEKVGLLFEMPYEQGAIKAIVFGATCQLGKNNMLDFKLKDTLGKDLGINIKLSHKILKDQGEAFIQAIKENKEISLLAGIGFRW